MIVRVPVELEMVSVLMELASKIPETEAFKAIKVEASKYAVPSTSRSPVIKTSSEVKSECPVAPVPNLEYATVAVPPNWAALVTINSSPALM